MQHQRQERVPKASPLKKSWRRPFRMILLASFFCTGLSLKVLPAQATDFIAKNGAQISGEIIRFTGNTITIRPDAGSMVILSASDIDFVRCSMRQWSPIEGRLVHWDNGAYTILANQKIFVVREGLLLQIADAPPEVEPIDSSTSLPGRREATQSENRPLTKDQLFVRAPL